jgi:hypothetical protein
MKLIAILFMIPLAFPAVSQAADIPAPVQQVMDATVSNWAGEDTDWIDIFGPERLGQLYSKDFVAKYQEAAKHPAVDDGISPFDYDVIVGGQDACPLEDIKMMPQKAAGGQDEIVVSFRAMACAEGEEAQAVSTVRFELVTEAGRTLIDDIMLEDAETKATSSLKAAMDDIAKAQ